MRANSHEDDLYPNSDGRASDSDWHFDLLAALIGRLKRRFATEPMTYVSGWLLVYPEQGKPEVRVAPDVFVVFGVPNRMRRHYLLWREGVTPAVVIELTSNLTRDEDWNEKLPLYRDVLRVPEVFIYDPLRDYLDPPLQGFRLTQGRYEPIPNEYNAVWSDQLGLWLAPNVVDLKLTDPITNQVLTGEHEMRGPPTVEQYEAEARRLRALIDRIHSEPKPEIRHAGP